MSINKLLTDTLSPFGFPVCQDLYTGNKESYFVFTYVDERASEYSDNAPEYLDVEVYVNLYLPQEANYLKLKRDVARALFYAGFTYPSIEQILDTEAKKRHLIFDCKIRVEESEE